MQNFKYFPSVLLRNPAGHVANSTKSLKPVRVLIAGHCDSNISKVFLHTSKPEKRASTLAPDHVKSKSRSNAGSEARNKTVINSYDYGSNNRQQNSGQKRNFAFAINQAKEKISQHDQEDIVSETIADKASLANKQHKGEGEESEMAGSHDFVSRHIGPREEDQISMLKTLGYTSMNELIADTVPNKIFFNRKLNLPKQLNEEELLIELKKIANMNDSVNWKSYLGMGYHDCITPSVILRNMFENPGWTTAYTAYQAEIAQGRLESLMNYQTMIKDLTGMDIANASLLDEATAAAEAMQMCLRYHKSKRNKFLVSVRCHPQTMAVIKTRADALQVDIEVFDELKSSSLSSSCDNNSADASEQVKALNDYDLKQFSGIIIQYPNTNGYLYDIDKLTQECSQAQCLVVTATDLLACTLFKSPGDFEHPADIAIGSSQRFGVPLNYGGPHAGFLACSHKLTRMMPGRVVGVTRDSNGDAAYRFALQTREQHIRRDKATSNICTAQALLANMSAMYGVYHGPEGLKEIAMDIHKKTGTLIEAIKYHQEQLASVVNDSCYFDTITLKCRDDSARRLIESRAKEAKINLRYYADSKHIGISLDETSKLSELSILASLFAHTPEQHLNRAAGDNLPSCMISAIINDEKLPVNSSLRSLARQTSYLEHSTFNSYRSEAQLVRYMKYLENKDISLVHSMIPLGSCTMKLNSTTQMIPSSWDHFTKCHPFQPIEQCSGYIKLFQDLDQYLCEITGYDRISFQPNSGAQGEYAGLRVIKSYLESIGQTQRNVCLIPMSAHGTNPASAQMAGFDIETIRVLADGNIDMEHLKESIERHKDRVACLMITYPSTFGVFEEGIVDMCRMVHQAGGQVYMDGANMNAQVGLSRPGDFGSDVSHLNLHKTFCIPHGGGGPGAGPIGVKQHLIPFLPAHPLVSGDHHDSFSRMEQSFGTVSASMFGSPAILPISWAYIRLMSDRLRSSSEVAILNANYMKKRLENHYKILFQGSKGNVAHEFILDIRPFKKSANIEAVDIAKRLQDFSLHAPTVSFPITNTLMIEPTESEDKQQLDRYVEALLTIRQEISDIESGTLDKEDNPIKRAPHTQKVVCSSDWNRKYTREQAAFPGFNGDGSNNYNNNFATKIWPSVGRVDDTYGDTNLFCTCPPPPQPQP